MDGLSTGLTAWGRPTPSCGPPRWDPAAQAWVLSRYADAQRLLESADARAIEVHPGIEHLAARSGRDFGALALLLRGFLLFRNPPEHGPRRQLLAQALGLLMPRLGEAAVAEVVEEALAPLRGPVDFMPAAHAIPLRLIARGLGLGPEATERLDRDGPAVAAAYKRGLPLRSYVELQARAAGIVAALREELAAAPAGSGLRVLQECNARGPGLPADEVLAVLFFFVMGATETTAGLLGSVALFTSDPVLAGALRSGAVGVAAFVDEVLRVLPSFRHPGARRLARPLQFGETELEAGSIVMADLEAAHQDPAAWPEPGEFRPGRRDARLLAFGTGAHACLGTHLARLEGRVLAQALLRRPGLHAAGAAPQWDDDPTFCRLERLELIFPQESEPCP